MTTATEKLMQLDPTKSVVPFGDGTNHQFSHTDLQHVGDPTGISVEEIDFLYGLVRIVRPFRILETGTNYGGSASAIGLALKDNGYGKLYTIEHDSTVAQLAIDKLGKMGLSEQVEVICAKVEGVHVKEKLDFLWLDSELAIRYGELLRFYPQMNPGAIACIHDLWNLDFSEFGGVPDALRELIANGDLRALTFATNHGVTVFQRRRETDALAEIQRA